MTYLHFAFICEKDTRHRCVSCGQHKLLVGGYLLLTRGAEKVSFSEGQSIAIALPEGDIFC